MDISRCSKLLLISLLLVLVFSCKKEETILTDSSSKLTFSTELVAFDTVFTTISSSTRQLMVYNPYSQKVKISSIRLASNQSYFSLNINGSATNSLTDVEIDAKDSLFIFIKANINPNNTNNPVLITDSILFEMNGKIQDVDLVACGQDAHFIVADHRVNGLPPYKIVAGVGENKTWLNDKPYVIYGYAVVDSTASLTINEGCKIYMHKNSGMWIYKGGNLKVMGVRTNPVVFQGDRREAWYADVAGQWDRIWINEGSVDNEINYAILKNGFIGIQAETLDASMGNKLILNNTVIKNMSGVGILAKKYVIEAGNNEISNCGQYAVALTGGGNYSFIHNTISNQWAGTTRSTPSVYINNYIETVDATYISNLLATFGNTIITGNLGDELLIDEKGGTSATFSTTFDHCLIKTNLNIPSFVGCIRNSDPIFKSLSDGNFNITSSSPVRDAGNSTFGSLYPLDINEFSRDGNPDIGAYEYNPSATKGAKRR
ncbi:MAG: hypothetical protein WCP69_14300 [Bacteroidota bacterium]